VAERRRSCISTLAGVAGINLDFIFSAAAGAVPTLRNVWLNLLLALVNAALFLHFAVHVAKPVWAVVWTIIFAMNPAMFLASFSELPSNLLAFYFLIGLFAWVVLNDLLPQPRAIRAAAGILCLVLTGLVALTRVESP
jgi:hypothetical protein